MDAAQAASTVKFGPLRFKTLAILPVVTFESSPGMVSSVITPSVEVIFFSTSSSIASLESEGRAENDFVLLSTSL